MPDLKPSRAKRAAKKAATDWTLVTCIVCFTAIILAFANKRDSDEAMQILLGAVGTFFLAFLGYWFKTSRE